MIQSGLLGNLQGCIVDGDTTSVKGIYSEEANAELKAQINSNMHFIALNGITEMHSQKQAVHALYALTLEVPGMRKLEEPEF